MLDNEPIAAKRSVDDLAVFGGSPIFARPRSTSNLVRPNIDAFLEYSRLFFNEHRYTNGGPAVQLLEKRLADFHGVKHCVALANGFWTLVIAMRCLALPGRHEVIMPSLTYRRLADVTAWAGFTPRFCEVDEHTLAISPDSAAACINSDTALLMGVHPIVNCCDVHGLEDVSKRSGIPLLFDTVESNYETYLGVRVGGFGKAECFSLHASKLLNGFEGGYLTTNDDDLAERVGYMRGFGFKGQDTVIDLGNNAKLNEVHASMALAALDDLPDQVRRNESRYRCYQRLLADIPELRLLEFDESEETSFKNIVVELRDSWPISRAATLRVLNSEGVFARAYYAPALHQKKTSYETRFGDLSLTDKLVERFLNLPCGELVSLNDIENTVLLLKFIRDHADAVGARI